MAEQKSAREVALAAVEDGLSEAIKSMFSIALSQDAGDGGNPAKALQHFESGLRIVKALHENAMTVVERVFPPLPGV